MSKTIRKNYPVKGIGCASCVARVQGALRSVPGVSTANVNLADNIASVEYDPQKVSAEGLKKAVHDAGYDLMTDEDSDADDEADRSRLEYISGLKRDTLAAVVLAVLVMFVGMVLKPFPYKGYVLWALATPVVFWCGRRFFITAWRQMLHGNSNMDTLVSLSVGISYLFSVFNLLFPDVWTSRGFEAHLYFDSSSMIVAFILIGRFLEEKAKQSATSSVRKLMGLQPRQVTIMVDGHAEIRPLSEISQGSVILVKPGERIAVDGIVAEGDSYVDESMLTGEPDATRKSKGDEVFSGTVNQRGTLTVNASKVGGDTVLSSIIRLVRDAQGSKAPVQDTVDKIASIFVPVIMAVALLSFFCWIIFSPENGLSGGIMALVTVLVIACPCSLGLAVPTAIVAGMGKGAEKGILIKDAQSLQTAAGIDTVVFDKTGTITVGHPRVVSCKWYDESSKAVLLAMEMNSEHPLSEALVAILDDVVPAHIEQFETIPGRGIKAFYDGKYYFAGNQRTSAPDGSDGESESASDDYGSSVYFSNEEKLLGVFHIEDEVRPSSVKAVATLKQNGIDIHMLTGDNAGSANSVALRAGIELQNVHYSMMPQDKASFISGLRKEGHKVAMAGDGINDSAALALADLSIAMGQGSDIAIDTSMVTVISSDLNKIPQMIKLSERTVKIIRQNLFWAFFYNILAVPVAAGVLYPFTGFLINPMIAAACMAFSSVCVVTNSLRLKRG
ncbi:MAG: cadmium-translocating P-type ATPase [Bacteroidales bacterium]|jgi:Cu2+-exporting ATPase|nr:cadmium-translocating P-type ATPase [Bacteroidales bacterium]